MSLIIRLIDNNTIITIKLITAGKNMSWFE